MGVDVAPGARWRHVATVVAVVLGVAVADFALLRLWFRSRLAA